MCGVTFCLDNLTITGSVKNSSTGTIESIRNGDLQALKLWENSIFMKEVKRQKAMDFYSYLKVLRDMSANGEALDLKVSLSLPKYTAIKAGQTSSGQSIITTLRTIVNFVFDANMKLTRPPLFTEHFYYKTVMKKVGEYNQSQNGGNEYNPDHPYYRERTYSGSYIYYGYYGLFY